MLSFAVKLGASVVLLLALAYQVDLRGAFVRLGSLGPGIVFACLCLSLLQFIALGYRWNWVNRLLGVRLPIAETMRCTFASQFFSQGLPASVGGDALRIWWISRLGIPMATAVQSVLLDRIAGLIALAAFNIFAVANLLLLSKGAQGTTGIVAVVLAAILVIAVAASRLATRIVVWLGMSVRARGGRGGVVMRTLTWILRLQRGTWRLVYSLPGPGILLLGMTIHLGTVVLCYAVASDTRISVTFLQLIAIVPPVMLLSYLPLSIGGWGLREGAMAVGLNLIGLRPEDGAFLGLALGSLSLGAALIGAFVWLLSPMPVTLLGRRRAAD